MVINLWKYILTLLSKIFLKYVKITGFLLISLPVFASSECERLYKAPEISSIINYGSVVYSSVPSFEIEKFETLPNPEKTMGITVADLKIKYDFGFDKYNIDKGICVNLDKIRFFVGYENLYVLISDKYKEGSCEYDAIKQHEIKHINVYQKELKYYGKLLIEEINFTVENLKPVYFSKNLKNKAIAKEIEQIISKNENIKLIKERLENSIFNLNSDIDNDEEFLRVKSKCDKW